MVLKRIYLFQSVQIVWEWCKNVWYSNRWISHLLGWLFENDVKMYGTQTIVLLFIPILSVWEWCKNVWYSNIKKFRVAFFRFENDVKMYGTQTKHREIIKDSYTWNFKNVAYSAWCMENYKRKSLRVDSSFPSDNDENNCVTGRSRDVKAIYLARKKYYNIFER